MKDDTKSRSKKQLKYLFRIFPEMPGNPVNFAFWLRFLLKLQNPDDSNDIKNENVKQIEVILLDN
jgi:hypothetical protein